MTEPALAERLAGFAVASAYDTLPADVRDSVRKRVLDILGICIAAHALPTSRAAISYTAEQGGRGQAHVVGLEPPVPAPLAAFANGVLAHSLDYDDTHLPSVLHPSACVIPAALAMGECVHASGRLTIPAIAVGLETTVRLGMAGYNRTMGNSVYFEHGQHATSICGTIGGAVAAALLLGLDEDGIIGAIGLAASMAAGVIEANRTGGTVKRMHCGWAAHSAVTAAQLAQRGFTGPPTVLEGRFGFFEAFLRGEYKPDEITQGLGLEWAVPEIFFKPYPANHFTHAAIDAGIALRERGLSPDRVERITLGVPGPVIRTIGEPLERKQAPKTGYEAQFSGPYAVVAGLLGGGGLGVGLADFTDELARDPYRRALMAKVEVVPDAECDAIFPAQFPAVVRVRSDDGDEWVQRVLDNRGGPRRPLSDDELALKFRDNAATRLDADRMRRVEEEVFRLDRAPDVGQLLDLVTTFGS